MRERVEERGLAGVGVADERHRHHVAPHARTPLHVALPLQLHEPLLEQLDPLAEQPPVGLELRLARAAQADAALLALEVGPAAHQARGEMLELRELDLQLALVAARALREDVEDEARAVDDAALEPPLEVALLRGRELMVEDDDARAGVRARSRNLVDLARSGEQRGVGAGAPALHDRAHVDAGTRSELGATPRDCPRDRWSRSPVQRGRRARPRGPHR